MKKLIIFTKPSGRYKIDEEVLLAPAHAKVFVETLGKARYLDKSLKSSPVKKTLDKAPTVPKAKTQSAAKAPVTPALSPVPPLPPVPSLVPPLPAVGRIADPDKSGDGHVSKPHQRPSKDD